MMPVFLFFFVNTFVLLTDVYKCLITKVIDLGKIRAVLPQVGSMFIRKIADFVFFTTAQPDVKM